MSTCSPGVDSLSLISSTTALHHLRLHVPPAVKCSAARCFHCLASAALPRAGLRLSVVLCCVVGCASAMPSRHSKNSSAGAVFTYRERQRTAWGTQSARISSDSIVPYDVCNICLHTAESPVACHRGHLYCRECIVESLAMQRERQRREELEREERRQRARRAEEMREAEEAERQRRAFLTAAEAIHCSAGLASSSASAQSPVGYEAVQSRRGVAYIVSGLSQAAPSSVWPLFCLSSDLPLCCFLCLRRGLDSRSGLRCHPRRPVVERRTEKSGGGRPSPAIGSPA